MNKKKVIIFIFITLVVIAFSITCGKTYAKYVLTRHYEVTFSSLPFYFDAEAKATKNDYIKEEDKNITVEITIKNNDGTNYNEYETKYEIF